MARKIKGVFITFEGPEGSGKSTHSKLLCKYLRRKKFKVLHTREPGGPLISEKIRKVLLDPENKEMGVVCEMLLYMAARAEIMKKEILPALKKGKIVVCDRFLDATLVYQGYAGGLKIDLIKDIGKLVTCGVKPNITFLLDIDARRGLARAGKNKDRIERKSIIFHRKVRKGYLSIARKEPKRIKVFTSLGEIQKTQSAIQKALSKFLYR
ncbi:MAG: dTMP kinase [Candidatus Omnitrophota bacterium]|nr:dTMP kinase [Candidatus Omnitrophota bacterium]